MTFQYKNVFFFLPCIALHCFMHFIFVISFSHTTINNNIAIHLNKIFRSLLNIKYRVYMYVEWKQIKKGKKAKKGIT